jgi:hypothetical protein
MTILNPPGITYICSSTVPVLPTGVSYTLMGDCCSTTPTPTPTPTKTKTPTPTPTKTVTPTKTPTPTPTKPICKNYKITVTSVFEIIQFTPCCGSPSSPMSVGQGITYVCSFTFPSVPTGVSCTLFGDCPTCPTPTPTPTPTKTKTPTPTPTQTDYTQCTCFTAINPYADFIGIKYTNCYNIPDQGITVPAFGTVQFCALSISSDPYGIASPTGLCSNNVDCNPPTPTPTLTKTQTLTPTKTLTPTPTPTKTKTPFDVIASFIRFDDIFGAIFKKINIVINIPRDGTFLILGRKSEFLQVILNIFNNAKEAMEQQKIKKGEVNVSIEIDKKILRIVIRDTFGGISSELLPIKLFNPFITTKQSGTGVGLALVKTIVEDRLNGTIIANNYELGAEFIITLPLFVEV